MNSLAAATPVLGLIAAFPGELEPLVAGWSKLDFGRGALPHAVWQGRMGAMECIAVAAGMGKSAARRACTIAEAAAGAAGLGLTGLVSVGWAGALSCGLQAAEAYPVGEVIDQQSGERFVVASPSSGRLPDPHPLRLVTSDHVVRSSEKRKLGESYSAVMVDMEASAVAQMASNKGIDFNCFKSISDGYLEVIPDFSRYADAQGQIRMPALLAHLAVRPVYWPAMARLRQNTKKGAAALAELLHRFAEQHAHVA